MCPMGCPRTTTCDPVSECGLSRMGFMRASRVDEGGLRLHDLGAAHFVAAARDPRVQRHVLRFEGGDAVAVLAGRAAVGPPARMLLPALEEVPCSMRAGYGRGGRRDMLGEGRETLLKKGFSPPFPQAPIPPLPKTFMFIESLLLDSGEAEVSGSGEGENPQMVLCSGTAGVVFPYTLLGLGEAGGARSGEEEIPCVVSRIAERASARRRWSSGKRTAARNHEPSLSPW